MGTHDFIKFPPYEVDLRPSLLILLGEIQSKIDQIARMPIPPAEQDRLKMLYFVRAVHGTTAIEGNTLSEADVEDLLQNPRQSTRGTQYEENEVKNVIGVLNSIAREVLDGSGEAFSADLLNRYHRSVVSKTGTPNCTDAEIGAIRQKKVEVGRYLGAPPEDCPMLVSRLCDWLNQPNSVPVGLERYSLAWNLIKAIIAHIYFAWIHPYCDGNGRIARLIEFKYVFGAGVPDFAAHLFSNMYNKRRSEYIALLQDSRGDYNDGSYPPEGNVQRFVEWALRGYRDELEEQCDFILNSQTTIIWHDLIHASFPKKLTEVQQRRKRLALDLTDPQFENPIPFRDIRELTPAVALAYANEKDQTIRNDLKVLNDMDLIQRVDKGYKPNTEILSVFFAKSHENCD